MSRKRGLMAARLMISVCLLLAVARASLGQKHEAAFLSGALRTGDHSFILPRPGFVHTGTGLTYQLNYSSRFFDAKAAGLYFEFPLVITPTSKLRASTVALPRSYSNIFFTPGIKLKLAPGLKWSPYLFGGIGVARATASKTQTDGQPNLSDRSKVSAAYDFGVGIDVKVFPHLSLRGEVRDFYTGTPRLGLDLTDKQQRFLVSAGAVIRY